MRARRVTVLVVDDQEVVRAGLRSLFGHETYADDEAVFGSIMAGAAGYLLKLARGGELVRAIRTVAGGQSLLDPAVYREDPGLYGVTKVKADWGKFRTPSLRDVSRIAPYMHNGSLATLDDVVAFYAAGGGPHPNRSALLKPFGLTVAERRALVEFLESLAGEPLVIERPELPDYKPRALGKN
jgi:cytochrome c peroxidase